MATPSQSKLWVLMESNLSKVAPAANPSASRSIANAFRRDYSALKIASASSARTTSRWPTATYSSNWGRLPPPPPEDSAHYVPSSPLRSHHPQPERRTHSVHPQRRKYPQSRRQRNIVWCRADGTHRKWREHVAVGCQLHRCPQKNLS